MADDMLCSTSNCSTATKPSGLGKDFTPTIRSISKSHTATPTRSGRGGSDADRAKAIAVYDSVEVAEGKSIPISTKKYNSISHVRTPHPYSAKWTVCVNRHLKTWTFRSFQATYMQCSARTTKQKPSTTKPAKLTRRADWPTIHALNSTIQWATAPPSTARCSKPCNKKP